MGSLSHMVQKCPRTHGARVKRHDRVLSVAENELSKRGYTTLVEPHIQTSEGMRKPDLIVFSRERGIAAVIDVAICSDDYELNDAHFLKVEKILYTSRDQGVCFSPLRGARTILLQYYYQLEGSCSPSNCSRPQNIRLYP